MIAVKDLAFLVLFTILLTCCSAPPARGPLPGPGEHVTAKVAYVIDGDTFVVATGARRARVRLRGVDAPEDTRRHECFGGQATAALRRLLPVGSSAVLSVWRRADPYGRDLAFAWRADGVFVNRALVRGGYAIIRFLSPADPYGDELIAAENQARDNRAGRWRACRTSDGAADSRPSRSPAPTRRPGPSR